MKRKLLRSAGIYTIGNIFNSAVPFFMIPVLTRYLAPADYGVTATFQVLVGFVAPFIGLSIQGAVARKYFDKGSVDFPAYVTNCLFVLLGSSLVASLIILIAARPIARLAVFPHQWIWAVLAVSVSQFIAQVTLTLWQVQSMPLKYGLFQSLQTFINLILSLWFVIGLRMSWEGVIWAQVYSGVFSGVTGISIMWKNGWLRRKYERDYIKSALKFGLPLIPHAFGGWIMTATDRIFINNMVGVAETGIYTVAFQISMIIGLIEVSFNNAWVPWLYERLGQRSPEADRQIVSITYMYVASMIVFALVLAYMAPWFLSYFVGREYRNAGTFIFWLALARGLEAMYYMTCNYIFYSANTKVIAFATFSAASVHVITTYVLVKMNGAIGAAQATFISTFVLVVMVWSFAARIIKMPWLLRWSR